MRIHRWNNSESNNLKSYKISLNSLEIGVDI